MRIECPQCHFIREVPDDKIPASASKATCPKCGFKFTFREPPAGEPQTPHQGPHTAEPRPISEEPARPEPPRPSRAQTQAEPQRPTPPWQALDDTEPAPEADSEQSHQAAAPPWKAADQPDRPSPRVSRTGKPTPPPHERTSGQESEPGQEGDIWQKLESLEVPEEEPRDRMGFRSYVPLDEDSAERPVMEVPWEDLPRNGFFPGLLQTIRRVMFSPALFFASMPLNRGMGRPLAFFLLISELRLLCDLIWQPLGLTLPELLMSRGAVEPEMATALQTSWLQLVVAPFAFTLLIFVVCGVYHGFLMLTGAAKGGYQATFRALCYAMAPFALSIIPIVGPIAGWLWAVVITIVAFRYVHRTSYLRVVLAYLLQVALVVGIFYWTWISLPSAA